MGIRLFLYFVVVVVVELVYQRNKFVYCMVINRQLLNLFISIIKNNCMGIFDVNVSNICFRK